MDTPQFLYHPLSDIKLKKYFCMIVEGFMSSYKTFYGEKMVAPDLTKKTCIFTDKAEMFYLSCTKMTSFSLHTTGIDSRLYKP